MRRTCAWCANVSRRRSASCATPAWARRQPSAWARLAGKQQYVYQLPWYIFIGPPGSGKTTALLNSGLKFPLADRIGEQPVRGIAGTRNCDWWFTDEAVMIDTAGRYVTQDSHAQIDAREWQEFMALLRRYRPRQPINGALVTVSVADLLQLSAAEREDQAAAVRNRVQELLKTLDTRFPVYLLVTKADLLPGFMEFFGDLGREEREQVWGTTFDFSEKQPVVPSAALFQARFDELVERIAALVPERLQRERDVNRRALIYGFAHQLATIRAALMDFIGNAFPQSTLTGKVFVRGFYLTSGTQEGNPIDRVMGALARQFGLSQQLLPSAKPSGKSFFLTRLLHGVIFPEAPIAGTNLKYERRIGRIRWGAALGATAVALLAFAGWTTSYLNNRQYVQAVKDKAGELGRDHVARAACRRTSGRCCPSTGRWPASPPPTRSIRRDPRLSHSLGLFQGEKLDEAATLAYHRVLAQTLAPALAQRLAWVLRQGAPNPELQYETLKTYVMLASPEHLDRDAVKGWVAFDLETNRGADLSVDERRELLGHIDALLSRNALQESIEIDQPLLARTRAALAATPFPQRVYRRLVRQGVGGQFPSFRIDSAGGPSAALVFQRRSGRPLSEGVPGLYTYDGYHKGFAQAVDAVISDLAGEEVWVLGIADSANARRAADPQGRGALADEVKRLYLRDYATTWEQFVADIGGDPGQQPRADHPDHPHPVGSGFAAGAAAARDRARGVADRGRRQAGRRHAARQGQRDGAGNQAAARDAAGPAAGGAAGRAAHRAHRDRGRRSLREPAPLRAPRARRRAGAGREDHRADRRDLPADEQHRNRGEERRRLRPRATSPTASRPMPRGCPIRSARWSAISPRRVRARRSAQPAATSARISSPASRPPATPPSTAAIRSRRAARSTSPPTTSRGCSRPAACSTTSSRRSSHPTSTPPSSPGSSGSWATRRSATARA